MNLAEKGMQVSSHSRPTVATLHWATRLASSTLSSSSVHACQTEKIRKVAHKDVM